MLLLSVLSTSFTPLLLQKEVCCCSAAALSCQPQIASLPRHRRTRLQAVRQSEDEGVDDSINAEFARIAARQRAVADSARLELVWEVAKWQRRKPKTCESCEGSGKSSCSFCNGTGAMRVGDQLFCSLTEGCKGCPVCKRKGAIQCKNCKGTGFRAGWMPQEPE